MVSVRVSEKSSGTQILQFLSVFNKTITPLMLVGYEIVIISYLTHTHGIIV